MQPDAIQSTSDMERRLGALETKIDAIYVSVEKTRRYFFWTMVLTVAFFVLPLIGLAFVIPSFLGSYVGSINSLIQPTP